MKKIKVQEAVGKALCHDITEMNDGFKGVAFKRGHIIREEDIGHMLRIGKQHIFIWEETAGESTRMTAPGEWLPWRPWKAPTIRSLRRERCCCLLTGGVCSG